MKLQPKKKQRMGEQRKKNITTKKMRKKNLQMLRMLRQRTKRQMSQIINSNNKKRKRKRRPLGSRQREKRVKRMKTHMERKITMKRADTFGGRKVQSGIGIIEKTRKRMKEETQCIPLS